MKYTLLVLSFVILFYCLLIYKKKYYSNSVVENFCPHALTIDNNKYLLWNNNSIISSFDSYDEYIKYYNFSKNNYTDKCKNYCQPLKPSNSNILTSSDNAMDPNWFDSSINSKYSNIEYFNSDNYTNEKPLLRTWLMNLNNNQISKGESLPNNQNKDASIPHASDKVNPVIELNFQSPKIIKKMRLNTHQHIEGGKWNIYAFNNQINGDNRQIESNIKQSIKLEHYYKLIGNIYNTIYNDNTLNIDIENNVKPFQYYYLVRDGTMPDGKSGAGGWIFDIYGYSKPTTTAAPVPTTAVPAPTTAAPVPTTAAPAPTTAAPAPTSAAPAPIVTPPITCGPGSVMYQGKCSHTWDRGTISDRSRERQQSDREYERNLHQQYTAGYGTDNNKDLRMKTCEKCRKREGHGHPNCIRYCGNNNNNPNTVSTNNNKLNILTSVVSTSDTSTPVSTGSTKTPTINLRNQSIKSLIENIDLFKELDNIILRESFTSSISMDSNKFFNRLSEIANKAMEEVMGVVVKETAKEICPPCNCNNNSELPGTIYSINSDLNSNSPYLYKPNREKPDLNSNSPYLYKPNIEKPNLNSNSPYLYKPNREMTEKQLKLYHETTENILNNKNNIELKNEFDRRLKENNISKEDFLKILRENSFRLDNAISLNSIVEQYKTIHENFSSNQTTTPIPIGSRQITTISSLSSSPTELLNDNIQPQTTLPANLSKFTISSETRNLYIKLKEMIIEYISKDNKCFLALMDRKINTKKLSDSIKKNLLKDLDINGKNEEDFKKIFEFGINNIDKLPSCNELIVAMDKLPINLVFDKIFSGMRDNLRNYWGELAKKKLGVDGYNYIMNKPEREREKSYINLLNNNIDTPETEITHTTTNSPITNTMTTHTTTNSPSTNTMTTHTTTNSPSTNTMTTSTSSNEAFINFNNQILLDKNEIEEIDNVITKYIIHDNKCYKAIKKNEGIISKLENLIEEYILREINLKELNKQPNIGKSIIDIIKDMPKCSNLLKNSMPNSQGQQVNVKDCSCRGPGYEYDWSDDLCWNKIGDWNNVCSSKVDTNRNKEKNPNSVLINKINEFKKKWLESQKNCMNKINTDKEYNKKFLISYSNYIKYGFIQLLGYIPNKNNEHELTYYELNARFSLLKNMPKCEDLINFFYDPVNKNLKMSNLNQTNDAILENFIKLEKKSKKTQPKNNNVSINDINFQFFEDMNNRLGNIELIMSNIENSGGNYKFLKQSNELKKKIDKDQELENKDYFKSSNSNDFDLMSHNKKSNILSDDKFSNDVSFIPSYEFKHNQPSKTVASAYGWSYIPPQFWSVPQKRPPVCIPEEGKENKVYSSLEKGVPVNALNWTEVGSILPKFEYSETYNPDYYYPGWISQEQINYPDGKKNFSNKYYNYNKAEKYLPAKKL